MTTLRRFTCSDLFEFNSINLDPLTETVALTAEGVPLQYAFNFYLNYLAKWPEYCQMAVGPGQNNMGYVLGKVEGEGKLWHGHVTAVTVAPDYRRMGLASNLMSILEQITDIVHQAYFVDLFVRASNDMGINLYKRLGYTTYRRVLGYYSNVEDALDMRKAMARDTKKESVVPLKRDVTPEELEFD